MEDWRFDSARDLDLSPGERRKSVRRETGLVGAVSQRLWWSVVRGYLRVAHRLHVDGREQLPESAPLVLVANHTSHLDALVLLASLPERLRNGTFPLAAGDTFFNTPPIAVATTLTLNALPMWRRNCGAHALADLRGRLLEQPCGFVLFPEGTRAREGDLASFKAGVGMLVAGTDVPVFPCAIRGAHEAWPPDRKRPRLGKIHVTIGAPRTFADLPDEREGWRKVAATLRADVESLLRTPAAPATP